MKKSTNKFLRLLFLSVMLWMTMSAQGKAAELAPVREEAAEFARESQAQEKEAESALQEGEVSPVTEGLVWQEDHYVLYEGGAQVTAEGWEELSTGIFYIDSNGFVTAKMEAVQGNWNLYYLQSGTAEWQQQKNLVCRLHDGKMYYFDARGIRDTIKGWKEINSTELYYVDDSGSVASKLEQAQGVWR